MTFEGNPFEGDPRDAPAPVDPQSGAPFPPKEQPGYYPGFSTLAQQNFWDAATRRKILSRVLNVPPIRFFTAEEAKLLAQVVDHVLPQADRIPERRIPIVPFIDERLYQQRTPGYRFADMPADGVAHRMGLQAIEKMAEETFRGRFCDLRWREQEQLLKSIHDAKPCEGAAETWRTIPVHRYWALLVQDCIEAYYAHPWAWDEIGFGGPAYPRAYVRLEHGDPEPWEVNEQRYEWEAPPGCVSDPKEADIAAHSDQPAHGQGGTH